MTPARFQIDDPLANCGRLVAEFYSDDQPRVPAGYPAGGQWTDVGGDEQGRGGMPVYAKDGRILKGHPSLKDKPIESLSHRSQLKASREAARAEWGKQARYHGHKPEAIHQLAAEMMAHDQASIEDRTNALKSARRIIEGYHGDWRTVSLQAAKGGDWTKTRGIDVAADSLARSHPHLFPDQEHEHNADRLWGMLAAGNPKPMTEDAAYLAALDQLDGTKQPRGRARGDAFEGGKGGKAPKTKAVVDDVPFSADSPDPLRDLSAVKRRDMQAWDAPQTHPWGVLYLTHRPTGGKLEAAADGPGFIARDRADKHLGKFRTAGAAADVVERLGRRQ